MDSKIPTISSGIPGCEVFSTGVNDHLLSLLMKPMTTEQLAHQKKVNWHNAVEDFGTSVGTKIKNFVGYNSRRLKKKLSRESRDLKTKTESLTNELVDWRQKHLTQADQLVKLQECNKCLMDELRNVKNDLELANAELIENKAQIHNLKKVTSNQDTLIDDQQEQLLILKDELTACSTQDANTNLLLQKQIAELQNLQNNYEDLCKRFDQVNLEKNNFVTHARQSPVISIIYSPLVITKKKRKLVNITVIPSPIVINPSKVLSPAKSTKSKKKKEGPVSSRTRSKLKPCKLSFTRLEDCPLTSNTTTVSEQKDTTTTEWKEDEVESAPVLPKRPTPKSTITTTNTPSAPINYEDLFEEDVARYMTSEQKANRVDFMNRLKLVPKDKLVLKQKQKLPKSVNPACIACKKTIVNPVICKKCDKSLYCSGTCRDSFQNFHKYFCIPAVPTKNRFSLPT